MRAWKGRLSPRSHHKAAIESQQQSGAANSSTAVDGTRSEQHPESMGSFSALQDEARDAFAQADKDGQGQVCSVCVGSVGCE